MAWYLRYRKSGKDAVNKLEDAGKEIKESVKDATN